MTEKIEYNVLEPNNRSQSPRYLKVMPPNNHTRIKSSLSNGRANTHNNIITDKMEHLQTEILALQKQLENHTYVRRSNNTVKGIVSTTCTNDDYNHNDKYSITTSSNSNQKHLKEENKRLRQQLMHDREELKMLRSMKTTVENKLNTRMARLEEHASKLIQGMHALDRRRIQDMEGWRSTITALRQRLANAERRQKKLLVLCKLPDNEHRDEVLERHDRMAEKELCTNDIHNDANYDIDNEDDFYSALAELCEELSSVKHTLNQLL